MADPDERFVQTLSELVNALQVALALAAGASRDVQVLHAAVERAARAAASLRPGAEDR